MIGRMETPDIVFKSGISGQNMSQKQRIMCLGFGARYQLECRHVETYGNLTRKPLLLETLPVCLPYPFTNPITNISILNRRGVARDLLLFNWLSNPFLQTLKTSLVPNQKSWSFKRMFTTHHVSHVMCQVLGVQCQASHISCQVSFFLFSFLWTKRWN